METAFEIATKVALSGWVALAASLFLTGPRPALLLYAGRVLPVLLGLAYVTTIGLFLADMPPLNHDPSSIAGVRDLWAADTGVAGAWLHFLAFDLFFGAWMTADGLARGVPRAGLLVVMFVTWWAGPTGLLVYLALRALPIRRGVAA